MTKEEAEKRAQALLADAQKILDEVTGLAKEHDLDGLQFMRMTFRSKMERWGETRRLYEPDWFDDDYWSSSSADCEVGVIYEGEEP